ncbi:MAG: 2-oxoglutarate dehydrogenase, E2 component, dihydrolipoamide succinyltransferase, partial [Candidatus Eremiobacteraeota bacterium]|nr:2-oxoglutarate dehydrogenase, E2 component, dihydrolipoamide succinyltransferase [Candidatus Eremiobacteraeota bacterium]
MATTITMPQLGETVTEGTVAQWLKKIGDAVEKYEAFVEVSTDKVNAEVPSPVSGVIREIIAKEGETVPTGAPIAVIDEVGAAAEAATPQNGSGAAQDAAAAAQAAKAAQHGADEPVPGAGIGSPASGSRLDEPAAVGSGAPPPTVTPSSYGAAGAGPGVPTVGGTNGAARGGNGAINSAEVLR